MFNYIYHSFLTYGRYVIVINYHNMCCAFEKRKKHNVKMKISRVRNSRRYSSDVIHVCTNLGKILEEFPFFNYISNNFENLKLESFAKGFCNSKSEILNTNGFQNTKIQSSSRKNTCTANNLEIMFLSRLLINIEVT